MSKPKAIDLFCGAGGASLGLVQAGFEVCGAVDADEEALAVYETNLCQESLEEYPGKVSFDQPLRADLSFGEDDTVDDSLSSVDYDDICEVFGLEPDEVDLICGCPPCQNFSSLRDTEPWPEDELKDTLLQAFVTLVRQATPEVVLFENVQGIMTAGEDEPTAYIDWLQGQMESITREDDSEATGGYGYAFDVLNAANYGVPQRRRRTIGLFVYGTDDSEVELPEPTHTEEPDKDDEREPWRTVKDAIYRDDLKQDLNLGEKQIDIEGYPDDPGHRARRHHDSTVEMIQAIRNHGDSWRDLRGTDDEDLIRDCHEDMETSAGAAYGIMDEADVSPTLTTRCATVSCGRFTHPCEDRAITFREAALLMSFTPWFKLPGKNSAAERIIGNAVPPELIKIIGEVIIEESNRKKLANSSSSD